jgi:hypothetical protein
LRTGNCKKDSQKEQEQVYSLNKLGINLKYKQLMVIFMKKKKFRLETEEGVTELKTEIMPLSELEQLEQSEKIETLRKIRENYTIKDISKAWGLSNPIQYYMWLKKQNIYEHIVRKADKFEPSKEWKRIQSHDLRNGERAGIRGIPADQFRYSIDTDTNGYELAQVFRRLSDFLQNEVGQFRCKIELKAIAGHVQQAKEWKEEEAGA